MMDSPVLMDRVTEADSRLFDEPARMAALHRLEVLDTAPEEPFDKIVALVRTVLSVPIAAVTLIDEDRQWFKAQLGLTCAQTPRGDSFCTYTVRQRDPLVVTNALADPRFASSPLVTGDPHIRSYVGVPLQTSDGYNVGALCAIDVEPREFSDAQLAIMRNCADIVVNELELRRIAQCDQLTGALTRRGFLQRAEQEIERNRRYGRPSSLVIIDIDHFKRVDDTYGHPAGDAVLRQFAETLRVMMRPNDALGRLGGEEFAILLSETGADEALLAAERFRQAVEQSDIVVGKSLSLPVTASFGIAPLTPGVTTPEAWIAQADAPLYEAKRGGRNRCVLA
jgi:diguanylate cyclase (GGDEF)-like protein